MNKLLLKYKNQLNRDNFFIQKTQKVIKNKNLVSNNNTYPSLKINLDYIFKIKNKEDKIKSLLGEIYYINMDSRKDRKNILEKHLKNLKLDYNRFSAFCPINLSEVYKTYPNLNFSGFYKSKNITWTKGSIGCFMSHYLILRKLLEIENPKKYYLILEDDCVPTKEHILASLEFAEKFNDLDLLRLNSFNSTIKEISQFGWKVNVNHTKFLEGTFKSDGGTHYVLIKHDKIRKILDFMESEKIFIIDGMYNTTKLNSYWLNFGNKIIYNSFSSIKNGNNIKSMKMLLLK